MERCQFQLMKVIDEADGRCRIGREGGLARVSVSGFTFGRISQGTLVSAGFVDDAYAGLGRIAISTGPSQLSTK